MLYQESANFTVNTSSTSLNIVPMRTGAYKRTQIIITNTSAAAVVTLTKGDNTAIAGQGIRLQPNGTYLEATDGGYLCWQGQIQAVSDVAGSLAVVESFVYES